MRLGILEHQQLETKSAVLFGIIALFVSFVLGLFAGNSVGFVLLRSLMLSLLFACIGFGAVFVLRKFVPEFIEVIENNISTRTAEEEIDISSDIAAPESTVSQSVEEGVKISETKFEPLGKDDFMRVSTAPSFSEGKLGKHFIDEKKKIKYEPKIIAEAIRTMIRRDE
ncbi:MAG: hypothetical protein N2316_05115 [Spirochaetes bacterium]|nr:hypothetical protein [Spirochaetota bacterium]